MSTKQPQMFLALPIGPGLKLDYPQSGANTLFGEPENVNIDQVYNSEIVLVGSKRLSSSFASCVESGLNNDVFKK